MFCGFPIKGYPDYGILSTGKVWSWKSMKYLKPHYSRKKYLRVNLYKSGKIKVCLVHRLVLEAFVGPCPKGMQGRHLNGNKEDNTLKNLKWGTSKENRADSIKHGTAFFPKGEECGTAKLTEKDVLEVRQLYNTGNYFQKYIAVAYGVTPQCIHYIINNKTWKHL